MNELRTYISFEDLNESFIKRTMDAENVNQDITDAASVYPIGEDSGSDLLDSSLEKITLKLEKLKNDIQKEWNENRIPSSFLILQYANACDLYRRHKSFTVKKSTNFEYTNQSFSTSSEQPPTIVGL